MAAKIHLSRRYMGWKTKTTNGDLCKYRVFELMGTGRKGDQRSFVVRANILTDNPMGYTNNPVILRPFKGKVLRKRMSAKSSRQRSRCSESDEA